MSRVEMPQSTPSTAAVPLLHRLCEALGPNGVLTGEQISDSYFPGCGRDGMGPCLAVVRPATARKVSLFSRLCAEADFAIVPQGRHAGLVGGAQNSDGASVVLSTQRLNAIDLIAPDDQICIVDAGVELETLQSSLAEQGQQLEVSIGAQGGVRVLRQGMMAAQILGLEMVLAGGSVVSSVNGLHKDNRGPDPLRPAIGGEAAFGIVTRACLRISLKWTRAATAYVNCGSFGEALAFLGHLRASAHKVLAAFEVMSEACLPLEQRVDPVLVPPLSTPVHVLVRFRSVMDLPPDEFLKAALAHAIEDGAAQDAVVAQLEARAQRLWVLREGPVNGHSRRGHHVRSDVPIRLGRTPDAVAIHETMLAAEFPDWIAQSHSNKGGGNLHFNALPPEAPPETEARTTVKRMGQRIFDIVLALQGSCSAEHGIGRTKAAWFRQTVPERSGLLAWMKTAFNANLAMNPRCLFPEGNTT